MHYKHILVTTDFSEYSKGSFDYAAYQAKMEGCKITLMHVHSYVPMTDDSSYLGVYDQMRDEILADSEKRLKQLAEECFHGVKVATVVQSTSTSIAGEIADFAKQNECDLIIMSSHGRGAILSVLLGSTIQNVLRIAPCPVLVVPVAIDQKWKDD